MPKLDDLLIFARIVEEKSITAAAKVLHLSPSSVSRRLSRLEKNLRFPLFNRSTHYVSLTSGGSIFYEHCVKALDEIKNGIAAAEESNQGAGGALRVHASLGVGQSVVAPAIIEFMKMHPDISVHLEITDESVNLLQRKLDVSIRGKAFTGEGLENVASLSCVELLKAPYAICAAPAYLANSPLLRKPSDLASHNCLIHTTQVMPDEWLFRDLAREYKVKVSGSLVSNNGLAIYEAALRGLGVARLAQYRVFQDLERDRLRVFFMQETKSDRSVRAYYPRMIRHPLKLRIFLKFLSKWISSPGPSGISGVPG